MMRFLVHPLGGETVLAEQTAPARSREPEKPYSNAEPNSRNADENAPRMKYLKLDSTDRSVRRYPARA